MRFLSGLRGLRKLFLFGNIFGTGQVFGRRGSIHEERDKYSA